MNRTENEPSTKEKLLDAAQRLMLAKGYPATTVDEICEAAGLTKGSFFHYFRSKEDLGKEALDRFYTQSNQAIGDAPFHKNTDPLKRVYGYVDFIIQMFKHPQAPNACLIGNFSLELSDTHPAFRALCAHYFGQWAKFLKKDLDEAKKKYAPKSSFDTQSLAEHCVAIIEGSFILGKAQQDKKVLENNLKHYKHYLKSVFEN